MDKITSRKNSFLKYLTSYSGDGFLCDGMKMLDEALSAGCEIECILWSEDTDVPFVDCLRQYEVSRDIMESVSFQSHSKGPVFIAHKKQLPADFKPVNAIILENVQDPGNVGTVIRTANAMNIGCVYLVGDCASLHNTKTIRATMGAVFHQRVLVNTLPDLPIYGAVLDRDAVDIGKVRLENCAVAIGNEGNGLSKNLIDRCEKKVIIPISEKSESLNAGVAASIFMWEMSKFK